MIICESLLQLWHHFTKLEKKYPLLGGGTAFEDVWGLAIAVVQTKSKAPDPIRTPKLSDFRHG
jgi:hypothetical protein